MTMYDSVATNTNVAITIIISLAVDLKKKEKKSMATETSCTVMTVIADIITVITLLLLIKITYSFFRNTSQQNNNHDDDTVNHYALKKTRGLRFIDSSFSILSILVMISCIAYVSTICHYGLIDNTPRSLFNAIYALQVLLLLISWFIRLYFSFYGSPFQVTKLSIFIFILLLFLMMLCIILMMFNIHNKYNIESVLLFILIAIYIILVCGTSSLYVYKLIHIYQASNYDQEFGDLITKIVLLNFISLFITIITGISLYWRNYSIMGSFISAMFSIIDIASNCVCIMISYVEFNTYYGKFCG